VCAFNPGPITLWEPGNCGAEGQVNKRKDREPEERRAHCTISMTCTQSASKNPKAVVSATFPCAKQRLPAATVRSMFAVTLAVARPS
jgi:hypothetical protein